MTSCSRFCARLVRIDDESLSRRLDFFDHRLQRKHRDMAPPRTGEGHEFIVRVRVDSSRIMIHRGEWTPG